MEATLRTSRTVRLQRPLVRRGTASKLHAVTTRAVPHVAAPRVAVMRSVVRLMPAIAIAANLYITIIDLWVIYAYPEAHGDVIGRALVIAAVAVPLHLRHLWFAVQGRRPPAGAWTLGALAVVNVVALNFVGVGWLLPFASLAVSVLIVAPGPWAAFVCAAVALPSVAVLITPELIPAGVTAQVHPVYVLFAIAWRTVMQYVPVRLVGVLRQLENARDELEARAVVRERLRIDRELREVLGAPLKQMVAAGEAAANAVTRDDSSAIEYLRTLVSGSRATRAEVRRIVARYQTTSLRADIASAAALLEAAGARVETVVDERLSLDAPDADSRAGLHDALARALRGALAPVYVLTVSRGEQGKPRITLAVHELPARRAGRQ